MDKLLGTFVGPYKLERLLGKGGMSVVYLARRPDSEKVYALKLLRAEHGMDTQKIRRFWDGGQVAKAMTHPHIVAVHDVGLANGFYYIAMDYIEGGSVEDWLPGGRKPLSPPQVVVLLEQIAGAIDYAHRKGVVHRDIKPSNILLSRDGRNAYLADFGISKITGREMVTSFGRIVGTPEFIAPEQVQGQSITPATDIYAFGVTAFEMLTGQLPFQGDPLAMMHQHVHVKPPSARQVNPQLPASADRAIRKAMAKNPQERQTNATEFVRQLTAAGKSGTPGWMMAIPVLLIGVLAVFGWMALRGSSPQPEAGRPNSATTDDAILVTGTSTLAAVVGPTSTLGPTVDGAMPDAPTPLPATRVPTRRATPSRTPAVGVTPVTPTPTEVAEALQLRLPADGVAVRRNEGMQTFAWQFDRPLAGNESFELRFYRDGESDYRAPYGWRRETSANDINLNNLPAGAYRWQVVIVRGVDGRWEADVASSPFGQFTWGQ